MRKITSFFIMACCFLLMFACTDTSVNGDNASSDTDSLSAEDCVHTYNNEYVCAGCGEAKPCSLEMIGQDFSAALLEQSRIMAGSMTGTFEVLVLDADETLENIQNYVFSSNLNKDKIVGGLFVKFDVTNGGVDTLFTIYYNFGLQFSEEMSSDVAVSFNGANETWLLEVVEGNKTIVFEYSIV